MKKILVVLISLTSFNLFSADVEIKSNPEGGQVSIVNSKTGKKTTIGKTPVKRSTDILMSKAGSDSYVQIVVEKPGFEPYDISLPLIGNNDIILHANLNVEKSTRLTQDLDLLVTDLFDVLRMIRVKDFGSASKKLDMLENKFPHYSIVYEMKGAVSYMQKEFKRALNYYRKAFGVNPKNREAYKMKVYLEKKFNLTSN